MDEKLNKIIAGVETLNTKYTELKDEHGKAVADSNEEIVKIKTAITDAAVAMQEERQKLAAELHQQKEDFELFQKTVIENGNGNADEMKSALADYNDHFSRFLKSGTPIPAEDLERVYTDLVKKSVYGVDESKIIQETKDLVAGSNADGGFFLATDRSSSMSVRMFETSAIRPIANVQTTSSDVWEIILDDDEPDSGWVGEVTARPDTTTAQIGLIKIPIHELYAQPRATQKMLDDAGFDIASWHQAKVTAKFGRDENAAFVVGDGASKPKGFLTYDDWTTAGTYQRDAVEQIDTETASEVSGNDLISLQGALIEGYQANAQWAMSRQTFFTNILTLASEDGNYLLNPRILAEGGQLVILGRPVNLFADMPTAADSALAIAYADWREFYTIVDRIGIRVLRDPYTSKPYIKFYTTKRVGGAVTNYEAGKLMKITAA